MENEKRRLSEFSGKVGQKNIDLENMHRRIERVAENIERDTRLMDQKQKDLDDTDVQVRSAKGRLEELTRDIDAVNQQLSDARVDTAESSRAQKKQVPSFSLLYLIYQLTRRLFILGFILAFASFFTRKNVSKDVLKQLVTNRTRPVNTNNGIN